MASSRRSLLQVVILLTLKSGPGRSVEELSTRIGKLRPSVSRSLKLLKADGLVVRERGAWRITDAGSAEVSDATRQLDSTWSDIRRILHMGDGSMKEMAKMAALVTGSVGMQEALRSINGAHSALQSSGMLSAINSISQPALDVQRSVGFAGLSQIARAVAVVNDSQLAAITRAIEPMLGLQRENANLLSQLSQPIATPGLEALLRSVNLSVVSAIEDAFAMRAAEMGKWPRWADSFTPLTIHFPKITESLGVFAGDEFRRLATSPTHPGDLPPAWMFAPPPVATAGYARALRFAVGPDLIEGQDQSVETLGNPELASHLREIGEEYFVKYQGMWAALNSRHPDYMRHVAVSGRELLRAVVQHFVPDSDLEDEERGALLKPRIRKLLGGSVSGADWVFHFSRGAVGFYQQFNAYTHADPGNERSLRALVMAVDGMLLFFVLRASSNRLE